MNPNKENTIEVFTQNRSAPLNMTAMLGTLSSFDYYNTLPESRRKMQNPPRDKATKQRRARNKAARKSKRRNK